MKSVISTLCLALAIFGQSAFGPGLSTANAQAPLDVVQKRDIKFGKYAANPSATGTVVLSADADTVSTTGGLFSFGNTIRRARFQVTGEPKAYVFVLLPSSITIRKGTTSNTMTVSNFTMDKTNPIRLSNQGKRTINIGATLTVGAGQKKGNYNDDNSFNVSVFYN